MGSAINIALPTIGRELNINAVSLGIIASSFIITVAILLIPFGRMGDIYGRKKIFTIGIIIYTISSFLLSISFSEISLIVFRIIEGVGASMIFATAMAIIISVFPPNERGRALGINISATYFGLTMGPVIGGFLTHYLSWRSIFWVNVPLGVLILFLVTYRLKGEWFAGNDEKFDLIGVIRNIFRNKVFAFSNLAALINYSATFAVGFLLSLHLQYVKGFSAQIAGSVLLVQPIFMAAFSPFAGRLSDKIEPRIVASAGMSFTCAGLILLMMFNYDSSLLFIMTSLALLGFGFAFLCFIGIFASLTRGKVR